MDAHLFEVALMVDKYLIVDIHSNQESSKDTFSGITLKINQPWGPIFYVEVKTQEEVIKLAQEFEDLSKLLRSFKVK